MYNAVTCNHFGCSTSVSVVGCWAHESRDLSQSERKNKNLLKADHIRKMTTTYIHSK